MKDDEIINHQRFQDDLISSLNERIVNLEKNLPSSQVNHHKIEEINKRLNYLILDLSPSQSCLLSLTRDINKHREKIHEAMDQIRFIDMQIDKHRKRIIKLEKSKIKKEIKK